MKISTTLLWLSILTALLAALAAGVGLFWQGDGQPVSFTTLHGQTVELTGQGLYRFDTTLIAVGYKISDAFTLLVGIPLLLVSLRLYWRGSVRGGILMAGALAYLLYNYSSLAFGAAYNDLLLIYIALTTTTLLGVAISIMGFDQQTFPVRFSERVPQRGISIYLIVSGIVLYLIWLLLSIAPALIAGTVPPEVASYTTVITFIVDMGIIAPTLVVTGILLVRRHTLGYVLAPVLLVFIDVLGLALIAMGIGQQIAGLISIGQFIGFVVSFAILTLFSLGFTIALFRNFSETVTTPRRR